MRAGKWLIVASLFLLTGGLGITAFASPRAVWGGGFRAGVYGRGFRWGVPIGPVWGFGWGWGNPWYWEPYNYYPGPDYVGVRQINFGTVEFKVKPDVTKVYVDKKFLGEVRDLDHHRIYVPAGYHDLRLTAPDGQSLDRVVYVAVGTKIKIDEKL